MIDNFESLLNSEVLEFRPNTYYKLACLVRQKDFPDSKSPWLKEGRREMCAKQWLVQSKEEILELKDNMIQTCNLYNGRLYICLDRRDLKKSWMRIRDRANQVIDQIAFSDDWQGSAKQFNRLLNSVTSEEEISDHKGKHYLLDCDTKDLNLIYEILNHNLSFLELKNLLILETVNGYHAIIEKRFDISKLGNILPSCIEIKKNAMTLVYYGGSNENSD